MPAYFADRALLPDGWASQVRLEVDPTGTITAVRASASAEGAEYLRGPLLPGMPNVHSHAFQRAMAGLAEVAGNPDDSFWTWRDLMYRLVRKITPEHLEVIARQLYIKMLKAGYTSVAEFHYLHHDADGSPFADPAEMAMRISQAAASTGIGLTLLPVLYSQGGFGNQVPTAGQARFIHSTDAYLRLHQRLSEALIGQPDQRLGLCFHSLRAVAPEQLQAVLAADISRGPIHLHIAEQQREVDDCLAWSGSRPLNWLFDHMPVDNRWCLVHATHAAPDEVLRMAASGAVVGLCPTTEANLGDGVFPAVDYFAAGGHWGIGSDSQVSLSVVEELRWLEYGQRLRDQRRNRLHGPATAHVAQHLYQGALVGGAQALGQPVGKLQVGARADWLLLDPNDPYLATATDSALLGRWLFAGSDRQVRDVMVAGRWVVRAGRHAAEAESAAAFARTLTALLG